MSQFVRFSLFGLLSCQIAFAEDQEKVSAGGGAGNEVVTLDKFTVEGEAGSSILPTTAVSSGLFGASRNVLETPRTATILSADVLKAAGIRDLHDLVNISANTYGPRTFGISSLPTIRGQQGEIFQDGMRRGGGNNGFGLPISFNAFDRIDVIKGPTTPILGSTQRVGGYVDLHAKRPDLAKPAGDITLEAGSYEHFRSVIDYSTPIETGKTGLRVSWEHLDENSFYDFAGTKTDSVYFAYTLKPSKTLRIDLNAEYYNAHYTDNAGWNRATQDLIDHGRYITGTGVSPVTGSIPGPRAVISPTGVVNLPRSTVLIDPNDRNGAKTYIAQAAITAQLAPATTLTNRSYFQSLQREEIAGNTFVEIIDENYTFENRTELARDFNFSFGGRAIKSHAVSGVSFRYNHVIGYSQFNTEADAPIDLTAPLSTRRIPSSVIPTVLGVTPGVIALRPGVFVSPGANYDINGDGKGDFALSDTNGTDSYQFGLFHQHDFRLSEQWSVLAGARADVLHVKSEDPIPPAGFAAIGDSTTQGQGAGNLSVVFAPTKKSSYYLTYSYSQSASSGLAGGFPLSGGKLSSTSFHIASQLVELGAKYSLLNDTLFLSTAAFHQSRSVRNRDGSNSKLNFQGVEAEATYRPSRNLFATLGAAYLDARYDNQSVFQEAGSVNDAFDNSRPDIIRGTGLGSPNFAAFPPGDYRYPGQPRVMLNGLVSYTHDSGIGTSLNAVYTGEQNLDVLGRVVIHPQVMVNAALFYRQPRYEVRFDVLNLTDGKNFSTVFDGYFGSNLVLPEEPIRYRASVTYRF